MKPTSTRDSVPKSIDPMAEDLASLGEEAATEDDVRQSIDRDVAADLLGEGPNILGLDLRPVTLATVSLLIRTGSDLVAGKPVEECADLLLDCGIFLIIHSRSLRDARDICRDRDTLEMAALELLDNLEPGDGEKLIGTITQMLQDSTQTQVVPVSEEGATALPEASEMMEGKG